MYAEIIDWIDLILVPAYLLLFLLILFYIKKKHPDNKLIQQYLIKGFVFKIACAIFYALLIHFYYGFGDSLSYYKDAIFIKHQMRLGNEDWSVFFKPYKEIRDTHGILGGGGPPGMAVEKTALLFSYISFNRYLVVTLFFAAMAYTGVFKMLQAFADIMPGWEKRIALLILFFPSLSVFGSGVLKDTLCMAALGWLFYCSHKLFYKKQFKWRYILMLLFCAVVISVIKVYILAAFIVPYILYLLILQIRKIPSRFFQRILMPTILIVILSIYFMFAKQIDEQLGYYAVDKLLDNIKEQSSSYLTSEDAESGSIFDLGTFEPTISGLLSKFPAGIVASIYRPFPWEAKKFIIIFSALESLFLLILSFYVIYKTGVLRFFKSIFQDPYAFLCIIYSLLFGGLIGLSTFNFGTLARYRIPMIPFFTMGLLIILYRHVHQQKPEQKLS